MRGVPKSSYICCVWIAPSGLTLAAYHVGYEREMTAVVAEAMLGRSVAIMLHCERSNRSLLAKHAPSSLSRVVPNQ